MIGVLLAKKSLTPDAGSVTPAEPCIVQKQHTMLIAIGVVRFAIPPVSVWTKRLANGIPVKTALVTEIVRRNPETSCRVKRF